jgi:hypothetical protein
VASYSGGEHKLKKLENKTLRKMFLLKEDEVNGQFIILHDDEPSDSYRSPGIVRVVKCRRL